jgi:hypothetical protein
VRGAGVDQVEEQATGCRWIVAAQERDQLERYATATLTSAERSHLISALTKIIAQFAAADDADPDRR